MPNFGSERFQDEALLVARFLLVVLFLIFGWGKLTDYSGTVAYMVQSGAPLPSVAALVAIITEFFFSVAIVIGIWTKPLAILMALYTLAAALIGHPYWTMSGTDRFANMVDFYKNVSIVSGFFLLYLTGPGRYSVDIMLIGTGNSKRRSY